MSASGWDGTPEAGIAWADNGFRPDANTVRRTTKVRFSWPLALGAQDYTLRITQLEPETYAGTVTTRPNLDGNACTVELFVDGNHYARYSWQVIAQGAGAESASPARDLYIIRRNSTLRITGFTAAGDRLRVSYEGTIGPNAVVKYEYQYYSQRTSSWHNGTLSKTGPHTLLDFGVIPRSGDYLYLTVYLDGTALNNRSLYLIP